MDDRKANYYQGFIGVLRWIVELGRVDIMVSVALLSRFLCNPREGHLDQVFHIFGYLKEYDKSCLVFNPRPPKHDESRFQTPGTFKVYIRAIFLDSEAIHKFFVYLYS